MKNKLKDNWEYIVAFLLPLVLLFSVFAVNKVGIGFDRNILVEDLYHQYYPLLVYVKNGIFNFNTYMYSFNNGLGGGMFGAITYFVFSPIYLLSILFKSIDLVNFIYLVILFKLSLCGFTMYFYLRNHFKDRKMVYLFFSLIYALSGYMIIFYYNILWLTALYMLPLIIWSIERLVNEKKHLPYVLCLAYTLIFVYYIGYMLCIFSAIYFVYLLLIKYNLKKDKKEIVSIFIKFIISSILSGLIAMVILLPTFMDLKEGFKLSEFRSMFNYPSTFLEVASRFFIGSADVDTIRIFPLPNIYSSMLVLPLVYFYFVSAEKKERWISLSFLIIMLSAFFVPMINYIWHGFNFPNWLNYRFAFMIIFLLIVYAVKGFKNIDKIKLKHYLIYYAAFLALSIILIFKKFSWLTISDIAVSMIYTWVYLVLLYLNKNKKAHYILMAIIVCELCINSYLILKTYDFQYNKEYYDYYETFDDLTKDYLPSENEFYRMDKTFYNRMDENYMFGNYGVTSFLSTYRKNTYEFLKHVGYSANANNNTRYALGSTPLINSLLNIKYIVTIGNSEQREMSNLYDEVYSFLSASIYGKFYGNYTRVVSVFENKNDLSLGYMVNKKIKDLHYDKEMTNMEFQKAMLDSMIDKESSSFIKLDAIGTGVAKKVFLPEDASAAYINFKVDDLPLVHVKDMNEYTYYIELRINDKVIERDSEFRNKTLLIPNEFLGKEALILFINRLGEYKIVDFDVYAYYENAFEEDIDSLKENLFEIEKFDTTYIKGKVNATESKSTFFSSIPYEKGWEVYVDGKKAEIEVLLDTFIGFDLEEGEHSVEFKYHVPGLKLGLLVSIIGIILLIVYTKYEKGKESF